MTAAVSPLDAWENLALEEMALPSGMRVKVAASSLINLMVNDAFPEPLMKAFLASGEGGAAATAIAGDITGKGYELLKRSQQISAAAIRFVWHAEAWQPVVVDVERFGRLPLMDQREIRKKAVGPELGEVGIEALATFRNGTEGDAPGADGKDVQPAAVGAAGPARPNRAARRARPRPHPRG